jgi:beta-glucosidase/6-phospho-beta-glucosidase/beta-galactosidase
VTDLNAFPDFVWSIGEEGSDPIVMRHGERYRQDQFAASDHYEYMEADLAAIADLGVQVVRYGTPWRLAEPEPGVYDWTLWDRAFAACDAAGLEPVVEFLHFGLPDQFDGFVDDAWVESFIAYVDAFLARYSKPRWFTPINEPGITARLSARFGMWNDMATTPEAHGQALANIVQANLEAMALVRADRNGWWVGSEGFDIPVDVSSSASAAADCEQIRALGWLVWDLHFGHESGVAGYFDSVDVAQLDRIRSLALSDRLVAGLDIYPISVTPVGGDRPEWTVRELIDLSIAEIERWHDRYGQPFWIAETSNLTLPLDQQIAWLDEFSAGLARLRTDGRPARGLCWYSRGDQFDWQTALIEPTGAVTEVGLFDAARNARPVAARFNKLAGDGPPTPPTSR